MRTGPVQEGMARVNRWHARCESRSMEEFVLLAVARVEAGLRVVSWNIDRGSKLRGVIL